MENWGNKDNLPFIVVILLVAFIVFSRPVEEQAEDLSELGTVKIAVIDKYNSRFFPETKEFYNFIADMAERDVKQYLNETGTTLDIDVIFYPVEGVHETLETVMKCKNEGIDLIVGMPDNLALDQSLSYMLNTNMTFMCIGATQPFGFNIDDSCFRLIPTYAHKTGPLAQTMTDIGIRKVIVIGDSFERVVDQFQEKILDMGGEIVDEYEYRVEYGETVDYEPVIESININLTEIAETVKNYTKTHPSEEIAILHCGGALPEIMSLTQDYPELLNVTWFSYGGTDYYKESLESLNGPISDVKMLSLVEQLADSQLAESINDEFRDEFGRDMTIVEANIYDGIWILVLSVIEEASAETVDLKERIPMVAAEYVGLTGRCELDEFGDRQSFDYTIWGYADILEETKYTQYGSYDYETEEINWIQPIN
ncbi:MAG: hypothetical protein NWF07_01850 [Candidatus Bathyarchaeota archaeon]|nr:hypothetical protein [Candidatus Bathyarchaeota archaeon]